MQREIAAISFPVSTPVPNQRVAEQRWTRLSSLTLAIIVTAFVSHSLARWLGLPTPEMAYRRIGPEDGPQVFCAGSSVVQFGLSWPEISKALGKGIENWGLGGSTPSEWEISQAWAKNYDLTIVGLSLHDLNEYFLCDSRADFVSFRSTVDDLRQTNLDWKLRQRILGQYPLSYLRWLVPTAGKSDAVLVGLRRKVQDLFRGQPSAEDKANFMVLPTQPELNFGASTEVLAEWSPDKALRRLDLLRREIGDSHRFDGPKHLALIRMLSSAAKRGPIILVVVPVSPMYADRFLAPEIDRAFDQSLTEAVRSSPDTTVVRLDHLAELQSNKYFSDFVHLNGAGRDIATRAFLSQIQPAARR